MSNKITIIGAGAWGSALAAVLSDNQHSVTLFSKNNKFEGAVKKAFTTNNLAAAMKDSKFIFIAIPSKAVKEIAEKLAKAKIAKDVILVLCSKGIDNESGKLFSEIFSEILPKNNFVILSGPNFASEVSAKLPTITTIASTNKSAADKIIKILKNDYFLPIYSKDIATTQICGAVKNILAIGCGIIDSLKLGENAKAALINKGIAEINLLAKKFGGKSENFFSPAGFGDLFLTCSSKKSRNNSLGILIGSGADPKKILNDKNKTYEGAVAAKSIAKMAKKLKLKLPVCMAINDILYNKRNCSVLKTVVLYC